MTMDKEIGGFLDIELRGNRKYHHNAIKVNSCRNALRILVRERHVSTVYIAYYTCSVVYDALLKEGIEVIFYHINEKLEPIDLPLVLNKDTIILYVNYWGICDSIVDKLIITYGKSLVVDAAQAFYYIPQMDVDCMNSSRKFFGVPDGSYLYLNKPLVNNLDIASGFNACNHLLKRFECGASQSYALYLESEKRIDALKIQRMSSISEALMGNVDYEDVAQVRRDNFEFLHSKLKKLNLLNIDSLFGENCVPMVYPFFIDNSGLKEYLIANKVFVPTLWPNVLTWCNKEDFEYTFTQNTVFIPIDQRYSIKSMDYIVKLIISKLP